MLRPPGPLLHHPRARALIPILSAGLLSLCVLGCGACASKGPADALPQPTASTASAPKTHDTRHLLSRLTFGPGPGDIERVDKIGVQAWLQEQLRISDTDPGSAFAAAFGSPHTISAAFAKKKDSNQGLDGASLGGKLNKINVGKLMQHLGAGEIARHTLSSQQLQEVLTDFFSNHFNVFARKGQVRFFAGDLVHQTIRPRVFGRFEDLLLATAKHPAMLIYLDNTRNLARKGINENYARELLELHTLGVDGGYTQQDVEAVAKVLSGWGVANVAKSPNTQPFLFRAKNHVKGDKTVLGTVISSAGVAEGEALIRLLARHPATAQHLSTKLCRRFVADQAPKQCVEDLKRAYLESDGHISAVMQALLKSSAFWDPAYRRNKVKSPVEFVVSALRALGAQPKDTPQLAIALARLGQPIFAQPAPTGWPDEGQAWTGSSAVIARMDFAMQLSQNKLPGVAVDLEASLPMSEASWVKASQDLLLGGDASRSTQNALRDAVASRTEPRFQRQVALALTLASPEFSMR